MLTIKGSGYGLGGLFKRRSESLLGDARFSDDTENDAATNDGLIRADFNVSSCQSIGVDLDKALRITKIAPGSPAAKSPLRVGDTVYSVNGVRAEAGASADALAALVGGFENVTLLATRARTFVEEANPFGF